MFPTELGRTALICLTRSRSHRTDISYQTRS
jgi:hypothetical protein